MSSASNQFIIGIKGKVIPFQEDAKRSAINFELNSSSRTQDVKHSITFELFILESMCINNILIFTC